MDGVFLIKLNRIKPLDDTVCRYLMKAEKIFFFEEGIKTGGVGECFASMLKENGVNAEYKHISVPDEFVKQASVDSQLKNYGLDIDSIAKTLGEKNGEENKA